MGRIQRLPSQLANQIAAGEVVERPASVVKELVENALDAGATRIAVLTEFGGKKSVRVEDDGEGMDPDDARLALERHATSKIARADDLAAIRTLGFRGEALPSIASVSHFTLRTRARGTSSGTEIRVNGGTVASMVEVGMAEGTTIAVADLFYNLPARRKFLKSDAAESAQISRLVTQLALAYPQVGFTLTSAGRPLLRCPPVASLGDRLFQLYGDRPDLIELQRETAGIRIEGYVAALAEQGPTRGVQNVFVNRRIVKDRTIAHAILDAYSTASIKERSPEVHLFLTMNPEWVDVNVHPTKAEVRFRDQGYVHQLVRRAVSDALGQGGAPPFHLRAGEVRPATAITPAIPGILAGGVYPNRWNPIPHARPHHDASSWPGPPASHLDEPSSPAGSSSSGEPGFSAPSSSPLASLPRGGASPDIPHEVASATGASGAPADFRPMIPLGQFRDTFIIAVDEEGIAIIDQHVAHERVLFERVMERLTTGRLESQRLLEPLVIELPTDARQAVAAHAEDLDRFGFEVAEFGGTAICVRAVPALLGRDEIEGAVRSLASDLEGLDRGAQVEDALKRIAALTACHAAVKANYPLTHEKMVHILDELRRTAYSTICPHGRPVMLRLTRREVEKNFQRI